MNMNEMNCTTNALLTYGGSNVNTFLTGFIIHSLSL